ncbi:MAG: efflux RND transporter permease subunit [Opitutaceae bacterium]|jgi:hydrophobe/amphiphile efflux-1 (HAE1) family protein|nr:efflux RND transporter permease subunit [Opitutaceae bacterium]
MARFFIDRPVFAWVLAILIMGAGLLAIRNLPVSQYPNIASPQVRINARYPGASAETVQNTVAQVIEQQITGVDYLRYMQTTSDSDGNVSITITFENEADPDIAQVQVQNRLQFALPLLPQEVQNLGVTVRKSVRNFLIVYAFYSEDGTLGKDDMADYISANLKEPVCRIKGVGDVIVFGSEYAMRVWLNADQMANYNISMDEVQAAIRAQNAQISAGQFGGAPAIPGQRLNANITIHTRLQEPEQFRKILLRANPDGSHVTLGDIARVELAGENAAIASWFNGHENTGLAIQPATGANALETVRLLNEFIETQKQFFPPGMNVEAAHDTTPFVRLSIEEVVKTLIEAIVLVFIVMYLFLQNIRATLIPSIAVPVVLLGTFAMMAACGFTINTLTMFGMVLAIGLLVDDAIVVVENVERVMSEEGLPPREATRKSMDQITGALVGIALVLSAVFLPMAFFKGATGIIYRQFSITIASSMALSVFVAMTLTPALCAAMLKPVPRGHHEEKRGFFGWFNRTFNGSVNLYGAGVRRGIRGWGRSLLVYALIAATMGWLFLKLPTSFLPEEDQGVLFLQAQLPAGSTQEQTAAVLHNIREYFEKNEPAAVQTVMTVAGFSFGGRGQNAGLGFVKLKPWEDRPGRANRADAIAGRAMRHFQTIKEANIYAFPPPAIMELGVANGFEFQLIDRSNQGHETLMNTRNQLLGLAAQDPDLFATRPNGFDDVPEYHFRIDEEKASAYGLSLPAIHQTLAGTWGSTYVDDFTRHGRVKRVYVQADAPWRMVPEDFERWYVPGRDGHPVPVSAIGQGDWQYGSPLLERFNGLPSIALQGSGAPGRSTGEAMNAMDRLMKKLPDGFASAWTALSYEEKLSGAQAPALYAISLAVVFLCLAALYESWSVPFSVMLVVPLGIFGAVAAVWLRGLHNDIYFQVGLITTVGLSAKNAILIVEFAKSAHDTGLDLIEATVHACRQRLRPILMTSLAFGFGVLPLAISSGAGSGSQNAIGTSVLGGIITATLLAIFLIPVFFIVVTWIFQGRKRKAESPKAEG